LSLDASNALAVWAARKYFHLPYYRARMALTEDASGLRYSSSRPGAEFLGSYAPTSERYRSKTGSLEHWLTERYCLYAAAPDGTIWRSEVHHHPWPLQTARATVERNTFFDCHRLDVHGPPAILHFARRLDVVVWGIERAA
jgi:uncharacterized protein YqjF (DUF2071 family)